MKIKKGGAALVAHFLFVLLPLYFVSVSLCTLFFIFHKHFFDISEVHVCRLENCWEVLFFGRMAAKKFDISSSSITSKVPEGLKYRSFSNMRR